MWPLKTSTSTWTSTRTAGALRLELLNVDWTLEALADREYALDGAASVALEVLPEPDLPLAITCPEVRSVNGAALLAWALLALVPMVVWIAPSDVSIPTVIAGCVSVTVLAILGVRHWCQPLADRYFRAADVSVTLVTEGRGYRDAGTRELLECAVRGEGRIPLNKASATLRVYEAVSRGAKDSKSTNTHDLYRAAAPLVPQGKRWVVRLELPTKSVPPYSLDILDNQLVWEVIFDLDIPRWPDTQHTVRLRVQPLRPTSPPT